MDPKLLEREIEKRRKRALALGVDRLITRVYYEHGFRNYALVHASSMRPVFPSVTDVVERERDRLDFRIEQHAYAFRARERSYNGREGKEIELYRGEQLVFAMMLDRSTRNGIYKTRRITAFVEGTWIHDFERIDREASEYRMHRSAKDQSAIITENARRFGINPANAREPKSLLERLLRALTFRSA